MLSSPVFQTQSFPMHSKSAFPQLLHSTTLLPDPLQISWVLAQGSSEEPYCGALYHINFVYILTILGKFFSCSVSQFPHVEHGDDKTELMWFEYIKLLEQ